MDAVNDGMALATPVTSARGYRHWTSRIALLFLVSSFLALAPPEATGQARGDSTADPVATAVAQALLPELLVRSAPTNAVEDADLARALAIHQQRRLPDDHAGLTAFLAAHPKSGWAPAILTNLGIAYLHNGHFSQAIVAWQGAWALGRNAQEPQAAALVDRAVGELARLYAALGQMDRLSALLDEIGERPITGPGIEAVRHARATLSLATEDPRHLFICGPVALASLMVAEGVPPETARHLQWYRAGPVGTSLAEVARLASEARFSARPVFRQPGQNVPVPSVVHWKVGHFATILGQANGRYRIQDSVFQGRELWVTQSALDSEASGYFLVPSSIAAVPGWRDVATAEAGGVWGRGPSVVNGNPGEDSPATGPPPGPDNPPSNGPGMAPAINCGMCGYAIKESTVSLTLSDTPVGYAPPIGPSAFVRIVYNQRDATQPANPSYFNVGPKWTFDWLTYVTDDPTNPGGSVTRYVSGGGTYNYSGYSGSTGQFAPQTDDGSILVRTAQTAIAYERRFRDGRTEIYAQSDGATAYPRNVFLTQVIDPHGNSVTLGYDSLKRLSTLTDATGRQTTFSYGIAARPLLVTAITDPFGRSATLGYDSAYRLSAITDTIGLVSSFTYDANSLVSALTTPYGTTYFAYSAPTVGAPLFVQATDPLGFSERLEWLEPSPTPTSEPPATVPQGMPLTPANQSLQYRNSFYWDKAAYLQAGCTPSGGCDYSLARNRHFLHVPPFTNVKSSVIESAKHPLENRVWYAYPGQTSPIYAGTSAQPIAIGRVLDDGSSQIIRYAYDTAGFNLTRASDALGRTTSFAYANGIDLAAISQTTEYGFQTTLAQFTYNVRHQPIAATDAAGQTATFTYNSAGQVTSVTNPLGEITSYTYDAVGNLITITNANNATAASFTYDALARIATATDSEGWTVAYQYDAANRVLSVTYPDGSTELRTYDRLDLASYRDRQGRLWQYSYDANRRLVGVIDPAGDQVQFGYNQRGQITSLTDPRSNVTQWTYDVQGRVTSKVYPDTSTVTYTYETTTSRLKSITDALGQIKQFTYGLDDRVVAVTYLNTINPTPNVSYSYDPYFSRLQSMTDGTGTTNFTYVPVGSLGALNLAQEVGPLANSTIAYTYDALGRVATRGVAGSGTETYSYDAIGRLAATSNDLGAFTLSYLGQTSQVTLKQKTGSTLATAWSYLANSSDRRLSAISNTGLAAGQFSNFSFSTNAENFVTAVAETADTATVYPAAGSQSAAYNTLNQLTNLSGQALTWDANGNLLSDGLRSYAWDAENRLVRITYPSEAGKQSDFVYDGRDRRVSMTETPPGGGSAVTTRYLWCGGDICQARDIGNAVTRTYHPDGELVAGAPTTTLFYGTDQLGSVRRVFTTPSSAPAFAYDPYGVPLQGTAPATDFGFASMFRHGPSGLNLTRYRAYDPVPGRWLSRDPLGEGSDPVGNLYAYVGGEPVGNVDPTGEIVIPLGASLGRAALGAGALWSLGSLGSTDRAGHAATLIVSFTIEIVREARQVGSALHCLIWLGPQIKLVADATINLVVESRLPNTPNGAKMAVSRGQGPKEISRIDGKRSLGDSSWEAHTGGEGSPALRLDGTWKHGGKDPPRLSKPTIEWLRAHGWKI